MPHSVKAVANRLLTLAERDEETITPLQMQKLVYFAQGWTLGITGQPLFLDAIEAWDLGPVVPSLYQDLKLYGKQPIRGLLHDWDYDLGEAVPAQASFDGDERAILASVWNKYGRVSAAGLVRATHRHGAPWDTTRRENPGEKDARIPRAMIREWFERQADEASVLNSDAES